MAASGKNCSPSASHRTCSVFDVVSHTGARGTNKFSSVVGCKRTPLSTKVAISSTRGMSVPFAFLAEVRRVSHSRKPEKKGRRKAHALLQQLPVNMRVAHVLDRKLEKWPELIISSWHPKSMFARSGEDILHMRSTQPVDGRAQWIICAPSHAFRTKLVSQLQQDLGVDSCPPTACVVGLALFI